MKNSDLILWTESVLDRMNRSYFLWLAKQPSDIKIPFAVRKRKRNKFGHRDFKILRLRTEGQFW